MASRSARTSGSTGFPAARPSTPRDSTSKRSIRQNAAITSAAGCGITPARASARASARSAVSIAPSQVSPETAFRSASGTKSGPNRSSEGKEDGLPLALEVHVEAERAVGLALGDERRAPFRLDRVQHLVELAVREVHSRHDLLQQAAGEDHHVQVLRPRRDELVTALLVRPA